MSNFKSIQARYVGGTGKQAIEPVGGIRSNSYLMRTRGRNLGSPRVTRSGGWGSPPALSGDDKSWSDLEGAANVPGPDKSGF